MSVDELSEKHGLTAEEKNSFAEYTANRFGSCEELAERDEAFLAAWGSIITFSVINGAAEAINTKVCPKRPVKFRSPDGVRIEMYDSFAGRIPIIYVSDTGDFEDLVTNVAYKGERPANISQTGASFLSGKTTRFIILSAKPYSNVPAAELGLDDEAEWEEKSMLLRRGHECTHYFTRQTYGIFNNILHDELMADFTGMYETFGAYKAEWFLRFMGVIPGSGGRMIFYTEELSENVRKAVAELLTEATYSLERWTAEDSFKALTTGDRIKLMCHKGLAGIAEGM